MSQPNPLLELPIEAGKPADYFDAAAWISLDDEYPRTPRRVFIRMGSGSVEMGSWDSRGRAWTYSPFSAKGTPVSWAGLPLPHGTYSAKGWALETARANRRGRGMWLRTGGGGGSGEHLLGRRA